MRLPMFPLGTVLFPGMYLPLHVFEPRYRMLTRACLDGDRELGVVLIERGSEVGGDDVRTGVGTVARIVEAAELDDGRWVLATVGTRRIRVDEWLPDDPYPLAEVTDLDEPPPGPGAADAYGDVVATLRRVLAMKAELGDAAVDATVELVADPVLGSYQVAAVGPWGPADQHRLLADAGTDERLARLGELLREEEAFVRVRLGMG